MKLLFWLSVLLIAYAYLGYPILLWFLSLYRRRPVLRKRITPSVSIVIAARNEENSLPAKLQNLRSLEYPKDKTQIVVVSDGSSDGTADILRKHTDIVKPILLPRACGKAAALNEGVKHATGEILVFMDVRQKLNVDAVSELATCFWDPEVGAVSGELILEESPD